jgi:hypothetical protein
MKRVLGFAFSLACFIRLDFAGAQVSSHTGDDTVGSINRNQTQNQKLQLGPDQKAMIFTGIRQSAINVMRPPSDFLVAIGAQVASSIELYPLPDAVVAAEPEVKPYKFTIFNNTVILVDPISMRIAETIRQ